MTVLETKNKTLLFAHIPKTGGTSICDYFGKQPSGHAPISNFNPDLLPYYFKFSFVRNPYTRIVSCWNYLKNGGINNQDRIDYHLYCSSSYGSFDDFIKYGLKKASEFQQHFKSQSHYLAINGKIELDFLGKFETINDDFNRLLDLIGLSKKNDLSQINSSNTSDYSLTGTQKEIIYDIYREDFENFDYEK